MLGLLLFRPHVDEDAIMRKLLKNRQAEPVVHILAVGKSGAASIDFDIWLDRVNNYANLKITAKHEEYKYCQDAVESVEFSTGSERYEKWPNEKDVPYHFFASRVSDLPGSAFPYIVIADLMKYITKPKQTNDDRGDRLNWEVKTLNGKLDMSVVVNDEGQPIWFSVLPSGGALRQWTLKYENVPKSIPMSFWTKPIPAGYVSYSTPIPPPPLEPGFPFPMEGWIDAQTKTKVSLAQAFGKQTGMVAVLGNDEPSKAAIASLDALAKQGVKIAVVGTGGLRGRAGWITDTTGERALKLSGQTTPTFFFVNPKGNLEITMMGFDARKRAKFEAEAVKHANGK